LKLKPFLSVASALLFIPVFIACGSDERITGVTPGDPADDSGTGEEDDDISVPAPDDVADDDVSPVPTTRPTEPQPPAPTPNLTSNIGATCETNASCGAGLECITAEGDTFFGGGPANGLCTMPCTSDFDCLAVDSNGFCLPISDSEAICVPACVTGDTLLGETKCLGRPDLACATVQGYEFCVPMCGSDADCPEGRFCDLGGGTCVDAPAEGDPIGAACDPIEEENTSCATGQCLGFTEEFGTCTGVCRTGTVGCGSGDATPSDPSEPVCLALFEGTGLDGDIGQCVQRCNCDLDCDHPDAKCLALFEAEDEAVAAGFGTLGVCINGDAADDPSAADLVVGIECEDGREPPVMSEAGADSGAGGMSSLDSGSAPSSDASAPEPVEAGPPPPPADAAVSTDGG
jgi:hypothetical protein